MKFILVCRRTFVAIFAIACLTFLGYKTNADVAGSIATVALALAASNAAQKTFQKIDSKPGIND